MLKSFFSRMWPADRSGRDFSLASGERQTAVSLAEIRYDHRARYGYIAEHLAESGVPPEAFGLDAFCAIGYGTYLLAEKLGCSLMGVDASREAVALANQHYANDRTFFVHKLFPFRLPKETFDFAVCVESLEHVADAEGLLREIGRSLKPGCYLFLSTPNEVQFSLGRNPDKFHVRHYTRQEVLDLVRKTLGGELLRWGGQNLYRMENGVIAAVLPDEEMELTEGTEGQLLFFLVRKRE
jgi:2-polyprenyl-3-methyl-5-hydroxy-6-metoxy-1,4-benzoquinol methylase